MSSVFRAEPPDELVLELFKCVGVQSLQDSHWWPKSVLVPAVCDKLNEQLVLLEPYYHRHKSIANTFAFTPNQYIHILRQCAKSKGMRLESKEFGPDHEPYSSKLKYRLVSPTPLLLNPEDPILTVSFS